MLVSPSEVVARAKATIKECTVSEAKKFLTPEILLIDIREAAEFQRGYIPGAVLSPRGLLEFVVELRELSRGKPVGFKLCVGHRSEFLGICRAMLETGVTPDFITIDGAEGGTGAAPVELTNSVGMPLRDGLLFVNSALRGIDRRDRIRLIGAREQTRDEALEAAQTALSLDALDSTVLGYAGCAIADIGDSARALPILRQAVEQQINKEAYAFFATARVWDDGVIDPRDTRTVLGICLSAVHSDRIQGTSSFGVFRM